jgi:hypothetical protein
MRPLDPTTTVAAIVIASFAIDRLVTAFLFLLSYRWAWADPASLDSPARSQGERRFKLWYFVLAILLAALVFIGGGLSVFSALGFPPNTLLDGLVTTIVLVAGSDRLAALLKVPDRGKASTGSDRPIQLTGTVTLMPPRGDDR